LIDAFFSVGTQNYRSATRRSVT